jgi:hypothetical protein
MFVLMVIAAAVASNRIPRLAARTALVAIATAVVTGIAFIALYPGVDGASVDRGLFLFVGAVVLGAAVAIGVLRARVPAAIT